MDKKYGEPVWGTILEENPIVETEHGKVLGFTRDGVAIFKGIPYGGSCSGEGRFLAPTEASDWEDVKDCTKNGYYAMQNGMSIGGDPGILAAYYKGKDVNSTGEIEIQGEDCLVLDVLTPGLDQKKRPVVFYIHGGGFSTGSGTMVAAADPWCREEDVVIVGVNHRLNIFGYLYLGGFSQKYRDSGCAGILDLVLALKWVQKNIAAFGGDPDNVTLMGESGGGMKVSILLALPAAKGLFHKAIVESGSGPVGYNTKEKAEKVTEQILKNLNLPKENWEELLMMPAQKLLDAIKDVSPMELVPVADEWNFPDHTKSDYVYGSAVYSANIPVLIGASEDEIGLFAPIDDSMTWENLADRIAQNGFRGPGVNADVTKEQAEMLVSVFRARNEKRDSPFHTFIKMGSLMGILGGGAFRHSLERAEKTEFKAPVYHYMNAYDSARPDDIRYAFAFHTWDLPLQMRIVQRDQDDAISRIMASAWAAFARTGDPSTPSYSWPEFTAQKRETMIFDNDGRTRVECDPYKPFWDAMERVAQNR